MTKENSGQVDSIIKLLQKNNKDSPALSRMLATETDRFVNFSRRIPGLLFDFSRTAISQQDLTALLGLAGQAGVAAARDELFSGKPINNTEGRPVLHWLWRERNFHEHLTANEAEDCRQALLRLQGIALALHRGHLPGAANDAAAQIKHVIHVGIGGSLLGPRLVCDAFAAGAATPKIHFISSVDAYEREQLLARIKPVETVIVLVSKSFTTSEVLEHARRLLQWQSRSLDREACSQRLFAVTAAAEKAIALGVPAENALQMGEWTGGRFSLWSPVGLCSAITMGPEAFARLCAGGAAMDRHFRDAPPGENLPIIHALLSVWHRNVCGYSCRGIVPYDGRLKGLPAWLQQVQMESNGKSVTREGAAVCLDTSPVVLGDCGTDAQHALFQAFHQGTEIVPLDFIGIIKPDHDDAASQAMLLAHMLAQASALALGRGPDPTTSAMQAEGKSPEQIQSLLPHRVMPGNRPSNLFLLDSLSPENLGMLLVLYEHSVFVESVIWKINAFDQWGVELGKVMADTIGPALRGKPGRSSHGIPGLDGLIEYIRDRNSP